MGSSHSQKCIFQKCIFQKYIFWKCNFQKCIYPKCIFAKCTRLACLLSFASLLRWVWWPQISSQRSRWSEKRVYVLPLPTRLTGKLTQVSIWGPLSQSCFGPRLWLAGLVHVVKKFYGSIFGANPILPLHRLRIFPLHGDAQLPPDCPHDCLPNLTQPNLTCLWAIEIRTWDATWAKNILRKGPSLAENLSKGIFQENRHGKKVRLKR